MRKIFEYDDYREYLSDYFEYMKKTKVGFSHRFFASKAGFSSSSYIMKIIKGERNLSETSIQKVVKAIKLKGDQNRYFKYLVQYNQSKNDAEKIKLLHKIDILKGVFNVEQIGPEYMNYFENWYYPVVRNIAVYADWYDDYEELASLVIPQITEEEARNAVNDLLKLGMLAVDTKGKYYQDARLVSFDKIPVLMKKKARNDILLKAQEALEIFPAKERYTSCTLLATTESAYKKLVKKLDDVVQEAMRDAYIEKGADQVYEMALQVFPYSKKLKE